MPIIQLKDVCYQTDTQTIIKNISFSVSRGEFITISGPSGGGKSTLLKLIASLLTISSGELLFEEKKQADYPITEFRRQVSYCFQQPSLFGHTVQENVEFPFIVRDQSFNKERVLQLLELVALPSSFLDKKITELSGGEKQRVALVRNLIFLPKVLLLDEVTVGLDEASKTIVKNLIREIHQEGVTILQISHDQEDLQDALRMIWIEKGGIRNESADSK